MDQVNSSWQTQDPGLIRAAEIKDNCIDSGDIADLEANTSDEDESSFFYDSIFDYEAVEPRSKIDELTKIKKTILTFV